MNTIPRSGAQYTLRSGDYEAVIASIGASLRTLRHRGRDLVVPFEVDEVRPGYRGATLAPWPNRVVDGRYTFAGFEHELALTEPRRSHALHGLVAWLDFDAIDRGSDHVTLAATIVAQAGYPWTVRVEVTYALGPDGLHEAVRAVNADTEPAPFGTGPHPYLVAGPAPLDEWMLELPASEVLDVTDDRLIPVGLREVSGFDSDRFDWRTPRVLGSAEIDHAFTDLTRDGQGCATVRLTDPSGIGVELSWDASCPWLQVHTADLPGGAAQPGHRAGLAVEPMTCAPDAFNADRYDYPAGLIVIEPGQSAVASWRIGALPGS